MSSNVETIEQLIERHAREIRKQVHNMAMACLVAALAFCLLTLTVQVLFADHPDAQRGASAQADSPQSIDTPGNR